MPRPPTEPALPQSWLIVTTTLDGSPIFEAGWRHDLPGGKRKTMKRRLGPAWVEPDGEGGYRRRRGRPKPGYLSEDAAIVAKDHVVREVESHLAAAENDAAVAAATTATFREVARAYMHWLEHVKDAKPSTLQEHRYALAEPGTPHRRGKGTCAGHIMAAFGDRPADEVTTRDVNDLLDEIDATGVAPRTVNKHRQLISAIYGYGCKEATFNLPRNPASQSDRRQEPERVTLAFYSPEEIEALARSLEQGLHRDPDAPAVEESEAIARHAEDAQDAELVRVAAYAGLRRGELVALRWRDVDFARHKITVRRAVSANVDAKSTKSRKAREVPLPDQAAGALDRLSQRGDFTQPDDFVFVNRLGRRLDGSALRRRVSKARQAAQLRELRFHDLRHTYGSLLVAGGIDLASVKAAMGHSRLATTERYLHARSASELADRFTRALGGVEWSALSVPPAPEDAEGSRGSDRDAL